MAKVCPIERATLIDNWPAENGIIRPHINPAERPQWPEALHLITHKTRLSYTLEAPSDFPLPMRVAALVTGGARGAGRCCELIVRDVAGLLRFIARMTGKMFGQKFSGAPNAMKNPLGEFALAKMARHFVRDFLPEFIAATLMNRAVADDRELPDARSDEQQNAVSFLGLLHAQMMENLLRGGHRIVRFLAADEDANLAAHFGFRLANRLDDGIVLKLV